MRHYLAFALSLAIAGHGALALGAVNDTHISAFSAVAESAEAASGHDSGILRAPDGLFYVDAASRDGTIRFLVDTGASHVVLSHADRAKAELISNPGTGAKIVTAAGSITAQWVIIKELQLEGHTLRDVTAAVPDNDIGVSLLGQNALSQFSTFRIDGDQLTLAR